MFYRNSIFRGNCSIANGKYVVRKQYETSEECVFPLRKVFPNRGYFSSDVSEVQFTALRSSILGVLAGRVRVTIGMQLTLNTVD